MVNKNGCFVISVVDILHVLLVKYVIWVYIAQAV